MKLMDRPNNVTSDREKLLIVGASGTRKTSALIQLAVQYPGVGVAIIDPDDGVPRVVRDYGGWEAVPNLIHLPCPVWDDVETQYAQIKPLLEPGDWLCIDMIGQLYQMAHDDYIARKYNMTVEDFRFGKKVAGTKLGFGGLAPDDWEIIRLAHDSIIQDAIRRLPCNVMLTAGVKPIIFTERSVQGNKETVPLYYAPEKWIPRKVMPVMEKSVDYAVSTVLYLSSRDIPVGRDVTLEFSMATVGKDRGRIPISTTFEMLWMDYCRAVGLNEYLDHSPGEEN